MEIQFLFAMAVSNRNQNKHFIWLAIIRAMRLQNRARQLKRGDRVRMSARDPSQSHLAYDQSVRILSHSRILRYETRR